MSIFINKKHDIVENQLEFSNCYKQYIRKNLNYISDSIQYSSSFLSVFLYFISLTSEDLHSTQLLYLILFGVHSRIFLSIFQDAYRGYLSWLEPIISGFKYGQYFRRFFFRFHSYIISLFNYR